MKDSRVEALVIHAVYLLNPASEDREIRDKSVASLTASLQAGDALGAVAVVLHPGSAKEGEVGPALDRAAKAIKEALAESDKCALHLEDTAGAGGTLGRSFEELATLIEGAGGGKRLGACLDSCHLLASGYDVRSAEALSGVLDEFDRVVGLDRLGSLHVNDSMTELGSNRDRHANLGDGEIGPEGMRRVPLRAALRGPAVHLRGSRRVREGDRPGRHGQRVAPARRGARRPRRLSVTRPRERAPAPGRAGCAARTAARRRARRS